MNDHRGCVDTPVKQILRSEGALVLLALVYVFWRLDGNFLIFLACLLLPDVMMIGYLRGTQLGAILYNAGHSYVGPILVGGAAIQYHVLIPVAIIWAAHIAFDRAMGYGLKYGDSFHHTHLGYIGRRAFVSKRSRAE